MARKIASTGPSPVKSPRTSSPSGVRSSTVACGGRRRRGLDVEPLERVGAHLVAQLVGDERLEVERGDLLLLVRDVLEALERGVERLAGDLEPELLQRALERVAAGVLAEHDRVRVEPDRRRVHDLVGRALLEHAVLVDAGLVGERVAAHDRLVRLHGVAGQARDEAAGARDLARVDAGGEADVGGAGVQQHHDLLERGVARALADAVDRALDLAGAGLQARERVGDGEAEVVVAVHGQHDVAQARHQLVEAAEEGDVLAPASCSRRCRGC